MKSAISDLRHLKVAELYEMAYDRFVRDLALRTIRDEDTRARLLRLAVAGDSHAARIALLMGRLNAQLSPNDFAEVERAALLGVIEVQRAAHNLYLQCVDEAHDPEVILLFRELAKEEAEHVRLAERILTDHDVRQSRLASHGSHAREQRTAQVVWGDAGVALDENLQ